jgi:hypothetical protein
MEVLMVLSPKAANIFSIFLMVLIMTFVVVFVTTLVNFGMNTDFFIRWMRGWGLSFVVAFPTVLIIMPVITRTVSKLKR